MSRAKLRAVPDAPPPTEPPVRIGTDYAAIRNRDWSAVHVSGDHHSRIVDLPDRPRRSGLERWR